MSVDIKIVNRGISKKKPSMYDFLETGLQAGVVDSAWRTQPLEEEAVDDFILYDPSCTARGIQVVWKQPYEMELYLLLPTCHQEIEAFYTPIQHLCRRWKTSTFEQDGETQELRSTTGIKQYLTTFSDGCLGSFLKKHADGCSFPAMHPLWLEQQDHKEMHDDLRVWLHSHQKQGVHYIAPRAYQKEDGFFGVYTIISTVDSLLPIKPETPLGMKDPVSGEDIQIDTQYMAFYDLEEETFLGQLPYEAFIKEIYLSEYERYGAKTRKPPGMRVAYQGELTQRYGVDI